jgi:hypothetical protein
MSEYFSGGCDVASRNPLIHNGATIGTYSLRFDAEGVAPRRFGVLAAALEGVLATANFVELLFSTYSAE